MRKFSTNIETRTRAMCNPFTSLPSFMSHLPSKTSNGTLKSLPSVISDLVRLKNTLQLSHIYVKGSKISTRIFYIYEDTNNMEYMNKTTSFLKLDESNQISEMRSIAYQITLIISLVIYTLVSKFTVDFLRRKSAKIVILTSCLFQYSFLADAERILRLYGEEIRSVWLCGHQSKSVRSGMGAYAGAARRRVHLAAVLPRPLADHRPDRRQNRHARILQIGLHLTQP